MEMSDTSLQGICPRSFNRLMADDTPPETIAPVTRSVTEAKRWYDSISHVYDIGIDPFERQIRNTAIESLEISHGDRVIDIGCGTGRSLSTFGRQVGSKGTVIGVDISANMCRRARTHIEPMSKEIVTVVQGDVRSLPFIRESFDFVFASFVIELFMADDMDVVLTECRRVLAPQGRLCVVSLSRRDPNPLVAIYERLHAMFPTAIDCRPIYLRETLQRAGFRVQEQRYEALFGLPVDIVLALPDSSRS